MQLLENFEFQLTKLDSLKKMKEKSVHSIQNLSESFSRKGNQNTIMARKEELKLELQNLQSEISERKLQLIVKHSSQISLSSNLEKQEIGKQKLEQEIQKLEFQFNSTREEQQKLQNCLQNLKNQVKETNEYKEFTMFEFFYLFFLIFFFIYF